MNSNFPVDWTEVNLGKSSLLKARIGWQGLTTAEYKVTGDYYLITGTDFKDGYIDWENCVYVDKERFDQDLYIQVKENDVLVTKDGTIGKVALIKNVPKPTTLNSGVFVIRPNNNAYNPSFLYFVLMSNHFRDFLLKLTAGSTISHLYQKDFVHYNFPIPPTKAEQTAIATALSDADALINSIEKLIAKKRMIKQGAMQELLKPKEGWEEIKLIDAVEYIHGKAHEQDIVEDGSFTVVNSKFVSTEGNVAKYSNSNFCPARKNDLLTVLSDLPNGKALAKCFFVDTDNKYAVNQRVCIWRTKGSDPRFLFYVLNRNKYFLALNDGVSQTHILNHHIEKCKIFVPVNVDEQTRIATILSDMDAEIQALETKLEKYRKIKQGMMQNLLTGKIRLI